MEVLKPIQPTMRIATAYNYQMRRWKGVFKGLIIKEVSD